MKKVMIFVCAVAAVVILASCTTGSDDTPEIEVIPEYIGDVITYPWPDGMTKYPGITMRADGNNIDLYSVRANNRYFWSTNAQNNSDKIPVGMFDMDGTVYISITLPVTPSDVIIRPLGKDITPVLYSKKITFTITEPGQYSVEYNNTGNPKNAVLIFANPIEDFSEMETDANTIIYESGIYQSDIAIQVNNGKTLYLKPGAVIRGPVVMYSNSKIKGRGIIDGSHLQDHIKGIDEVVLPIETFNRSNLEISGITIFDPNAWAVQLQNSSNIIVDNLKILSSRCNSDGISIQSSNSITIQNCFLRTWDDSVVIKNYGQLDSYDITVKNCVFWTDLAQTMEIGFETNKGKKSDPKIHNVLFEDILIFHAMHKAPVSIHNGDNAEIYDITFRNIIVEDYQSGNGDGWNYLIDISNLRDSNWTMVQDRGSIHDVLVENVSILSGKNPGARFNSSQGGSIYDVTVRDIYRDTTKLDFSDKVGAGTNTTVTFE